MLHYLDLLKSRVRKGLGFTQLKPINGFQSEVVDLQVREETM